MTKNEFLRELENSLKGLFSQEDINEVISDYNDIFDNGRIEGKSEDDISNEIGSPANISRTILDDINNSERSFNNNQTIKTDILNLTSMSKRLGAYVIDTFSISLIIALILFITSYAFYGVTTGSSVVSERSSVVSENGEVISVPANDYEERTFMDKNGKIARKEFFKNGKRVFKGTAEEYSEFLINNGIDSNEITSFETVSHMQFDIFNLIAIFPIAILLMFFGFSNIITAFELWIFKGYTFGKWILKIKVQRIDGKKITFWDSFLRDALIKSIGNSITYGILNIVSFVWGCATPEHKTVQDLAAKTKVIDVVR